MNFDMNNITLIRNIDEVKGLALVAISNVGLDVVGPLGLQVAVRTLEFGLLAAGVAKMTDQGLFALEHLPAHRAGMDLGYPNAPNGRALFFTGRGLVGTSGAATDRRSPIQIVAAAHQVTAQKAETGVRVVAVVTAKPIGRRFWDL